MITYRSDETVAEWMRAYWRSQGEDIDWPKPYICFGAELDGEIKLGVIYEGYNVWDVNMHIVLTDRRAITRRVLQAGFDFPFNRLKVQRVTGLVPVDNMAAREFDEKLGFVQEGRKRHAFAGKVDGIYYGMLREDCRWIK